VELPSRPPQHETDTGACRAFERALPAAWIARRQSDDYGVDYIVEVFRDGSTTGELFAVQVKGAGQVSGTPAVRLKVRTLNYWRSLDIPTLVVLWERTSDRIWWRWSHHFDPWQIDMAGETFRFEFDSTQTWETQDTPAELEREVQAWRAWRSPGVDVPVHVVIDSHTTTVFDRPVGAFLAALRSHISGLHGVLEARAATDRRLHLRVLIGLDQTVVWVAGGGSATLHHPDGAFESLSSDQVSALWAADLCVLIASQLSRVHLVQQAARVAALAAPTSSVVMNPGIADAVVRMIFEGNRVDEAMTLVGRLVLASEADHDSLGGLGALSGLLASLEGADRWTVDRVVSTMSGWAAEAAESGDDGAAARLTYSAGRVLGAGDPVRAGEMLDEAARYDSSYLQRDYWQEERGGFAFLVGEYSKAADCYARALELGSQSCRALHADALMFCGRFSDALSEFTAVCADDQSTQAEWRLKSVVLSFLIESLGASDQPRQPDEAMALADAGRLEEALRLDALCGAALFQLGLAASERDEPASMWFLASAVAVPHVPIAWFNTIVSGMPEGCAWVPDAVATARRVAGTQIVQFLLEMDDTGESAQLMAALFEAAPDDHDVAPSSVVRMTRAGSETYVPIEVGADWRIPPAQPA